MENIFTNSPVSSKACPLVKNSYLSTFPDDKVKILICFQSKSYRAFVCLILLSIGLIFLLWTFYNWFFLKLHLKNATGGMSI